MKYQAEREAIIAAARYMQRSGMIRLTSGNISVKVEDGFLITPSGMDYEGLKPEDISLLDKGGKLVEGCPPSSELKLHLAVYAAREDVGAVVHSHSKFSTIMASVCGQLPAVTVPGCEFFPVNSMPFIMPGSQELAETVVEKLGKGSAVIMAHHGLVCAGATLAKAMKAAEYVEENAEIAYYLHLAGCKSSVPEGDIAGLKAALAYGKAI